LRGGTVASALDIDASQQFAARRCSEELDTRRPKRDVAPRSSQRFARPALHPCPCARCLKVLANAAQERLQAAVCSTLAMSHEEALPLAHSRKGTTVDGLREKTNTNCPLEKTDRPVPVACLEKHPLVLGSARRMNSPETEGAHHSWHWILCRLTFDMSGKQRRARCSQNSQLLPAVVCPLDGGVSRHGVLLAVRAMVATAQRLRPLHATNATHSAAGMGRTADAGLGARTKQRRRCVLAGPGRRASVALRAETLTTAAQTAELLRAHAHRCAGRRRTDSPARCRRLLWWCFNNWCAGRRRTDGPAQRLRKLSLPRTHSASPTSAFAKNDSPFHSTPVRLA
jgi:hypothetical protein